MKLFLLIPFLLMPSFASAAFPDVPKTHPHYDAINYVQSEGIVEGYSNGTYGPDKTINRAEFVKILSYVVLGHAPQDFDAKCFGLTEKQNMRSEQGTFIFRDVDAGPTMDWFAVPVCAGFTLGLIDGYPDGTFRPANQINFVESAKILMNAFGLHTDVVYKGPWYELPVTMLQNQHAIPLSITRFDQPITRGEMAEMVYRLKTMNTEKESRTYQDIQVWQNRSLIFPLGISTWSAGYSSEGVPPIGALDRKSVGIVTTYVPYSNKGISFLVPFNPDWGTDKHSIRPYEESDTSVFFGPLIACEGGWCRDQGLFIKPAMTAKDLIANLHKENMRVEAEHGGKRFSEPIIKAIGNVQVVQYYESYDWDADFDKTYLKMQVIGKSANYEFSLTGFYPFDSIEPYDSEEKRYDHIESIIKTVKLD